MINGIINKVELKLSSETAANENILYSIMEFTYYSGLKKLNDNSILQWAFEEIFYDIVCTRYGFESKKMAEKILVGICEQAQSDERYSLFADLLGLGQKKIEYKIIFLFFVILKSTKMHLCEILKANQEKSMQLTKAFIIIIS